MAKDKTDYAPLLPPGLHRIELADLESHFVTPFDQSARRVEMVARLRAYVSALAEIGIPLELWLNGSFATHKLDPDDIDVAIFASAPIVDALDTERKRRLSQLLDRPTVRLRYSCDVYFLPREDEELRSYWRGWFGFTRAEDPKGIPYIIAA